MSETNNPTGDPRFRKILDELWELHCRKAADYGAEQSPLHNLRQSALWGIPPWLATFVRLGDKVARLQRFAVRRQLENESVDDSLLDLAAYAILALMLIREEKT